VIESKEIKQDKPAFVTPFLKVEVEKHLFQKAELLNTSGTCFRFFAENCYIFKLSF
jgi:hypothetical protein